MNATIRKTLILWLLVGWCGTVNAQTITTTAGSVTSCPGEIQVPVNVTDGNGIGAISLVLNYDNTRLTYLGYQNLHVALTSGFLIINNTGTSIVISWANTTAANLGNSTMVKLRFNAIPGNSNLTWDTQTPGNCEYSDLLGNILPATFINGTASTHQNPVITNQPVNKTVLVGQSTTFSLTASAAGIAYQWQISTNGGSTWSNLSNNSTYSNVTSSTLSISNIILSMNGYMYKCRVSGTCPPEVWSSEVTLTVINPITTILPTATFCPGNIIVPVTVTNFTSVAAFSMVFSYNTSVLTYTGYQSVNGALSPGMLAVNAAGGQVYMTWSHSAAVSFGNGTIIELLFSAASGTSPLTWNIFDEGFCEYVGPEGSPIISVWTNGNETIHFLPTVSSHPANKTIAKSQSTSFSITAAGTGLAYLWQVSVNGGGTYTNLTDAGNYSGTTTPNLTVSNAQLAMSGNYYRCRVTGTCAPVVFSNPAILTVLPNIFTTCGSGTVCPGQLVIPVTVNDFIDVGSFSLTLAFNPAVLTFTGHQNLHPNLAPGSFVSNASGGKVYLTWYHSAGVTLPAASTLAEIIFTGVPGSSSLTWDIQTAGGCEYVDPSGLVIFSTWTNGSATILSPPSISGQPVNKTIYAGGNTTFSVTASGSGLLYQWQVSTNGGVSYTNLTNSSPYSGVYTSVLTINSATTGLNGNFYRCSVSGSCIPGVNSGGAQLTVTQAAVLVTAESVSNSCTGNITIPVTVANCTNVGGFSLTLTYDTTKFSYEGYQALNGALASGMMVVNRSANKVYFTWAATAPLSLGSGTLIQYRFKANPGISSAMSWDTQTTGACEFSDPNGTVITSFYTNATISIQTNALVVNAGPDINSSGGPVQLNGSASGSTTPYTYSWSPTASLSNPNIANPAATPGVSTVYTLTVTSAAGCTGYDAMEVIVTAVPVNLNIQNVTIPDGVSPCYDATNTITVAGGGTTFLVQDGGSALLIAGQKIRFLPGTRVEHGGYLHGYITTDGQYCSAVQPPPVVASAREQAATMESAGNLCRLYPNPTSGTFTLEWNEPVPGTGQVICHDMYGHTVFSIDAKSEHLFRLSLEGQPAGIYLLRVICLDKQEIHKVILR